MIRPWPLMFVAVVFVTVTIAASVATAQTVIVRRAPPGATIEVMAGATAVGSATVDALGDATVGLKTFPRAPATEMSAQIFVDVCGTVRRVILVERSFQAPPVAADCVRRAIAGFFVVRQVTTLVLDVGEMAPTLRLRQGPAPAAWLRQGPEPEPSMWASAPGLEVFGGGSFVEFREAIGRACGNVRPCTGRDFNPAYTAGAAYWISRFFGAHASYLRAGAVTATGSGNLFRFDHAFDAETLTIGGIVGVPVSRTRLYGRFGASYHRAAAVTTEATDDVTAIVDGVPQTVKGGTGTFVLNTSGWSWQLAGGFDVWMTPAFAIFGEAGIGPLKGSNRDAVEGVMNDQITFVLTGARVRLRGLGLGR